MSATPTLRRVLLQCAFLLTLVGLAVWAAGRLQTGTQARGVLFGFEFLRMSLGVSVSDSVVPLASTDSVLHGILVGGVNTLLITVLASLLATLIGFGVAGLRLSAHPLLQGVLGAYVHLVRNTPLLLQILLWYALWLRLPPVSQAWSLGDVVFLSQRGLQLPALAWDLGGGFPWPAIELSVHRGFNFQGGLAVSPELAALLAGLSLYAGAFLAEALRGGINAVSVGQWDASHGVGLSRLNTLRFVILPQALRAALPAMTTQYAGVMKSSSLAIVLGYPDLLWVLHAAINTYGRELEGSLLVLLGYLVPTAIGAGLLNRLNSGLVKRGGS